MWVKMCEICDTMCDPNTSVPFEVGPVSSSPRCGHTDAFSHKGTHRSGSWRAEGRQHRVAEITTGEMEHWDVILISSQVKCHFY